MIDDSSSIEVLTATSGRSNRSFGAGPGGVVAAEHAEGGEQHREDEAVAHQVDPEAEHGAVAFRMRVLVGEVEDRLAGLRSGLTATVMLLGSGEQLGARVFGPDDVVRRNVEVAV